ncbi:UDP-N-acetylmuramate--L-alanine ligase [Stakelama sediminis]|uniref:UDP-N-acetylmuramate--alanine ligase n=1 Tax=Stakelama sediminis TaxID=463200 RepID=A0A840YZT7_9SPHN|nr:Mur ligase family protein [Stakelama sediminis]MBB5719014.1 UDP-N-acetylmuramate--alanine ligase [Stakelama sediminis]
MDMRKPCFFVGIGGSGMMPLAMILHARGVPVAGSDRALDAGRVPAKFDALRDRGIDLYPQDGSGITSPDQVVIASAAVEDSVPDMVKAREVGAERMTRPELLSRLFNDAVLPIGVAGTSGKSTVTGMIARIFHSVGRDPTVMNGAVMKNFVADDAPFASALVGKGDAFVSEVDESDGSIALYNPKIAVLNNVSHDHKSMEELRALFGDFVRRADAAVINIGDAEAAAIAMTVDREQRLTFAVDREANLTARHLKPDPFGIAFDLYIAGDFRRRVTLAVPGAHNVANALAALGVALSTSIPPGRALDALEGFTGLKRRFERVGEAGGIAVIDDFGHNPDKIAATLDTCHAFPGRLLILFQPHGFGPLKVMRRDLVAMFAKKLAKGDELVLCDPVYQGGTVSRDVTSADIVADVAATGCNARHIPDRAAAAAHLVATAKPGDRILVMGARDDTLSLLAKDMLESIAARS